MTPPAPKPSVRVIEELRKLHSEATEGPWHTDAYERAAIICDHAALEWHSEEWGSVSLIDPSLRPRDAKLIVAMHRHLPALLSAADSLRELLADHEATHGRCDRAFPDICMYCRARQALSALDATGGGL